MESGNMMNSGSQLVSMIKRTIKAIHPSIKVSKILNLINNCNNIDYRDYDGNTALIYAMEFRCKNWNLVLSRLINKSSIQDHQKILCKAMKCKYPDVVIQLLNRYDQILITKSLAKNIDAVPSNVLVTILTKGVILPEAYHTLINLMDRSIEHSNFHTFKYVIEVMYILTVWIEKGDCCELDHLKYMYIEMVIKFYELKLGSEYVSKMYNLKDRIIERKQ